MTGRTGDPLLPSGGGGDGDANNFSSSRDDLLLPLSDDFPCLPSPPWLMEDGDDVLMEFALLQQQSDPGSTIKEIEEDEDEADFAATAADLRDLFHHHSSSAQLSPPPSSEGSGEEQDISSLTDFAEDNNNCIGDSNSQKDVHQCSVCKLVFTNAAGLASHRASSAAEMSCCHCRKSFSSNSKLITHHRKHSKEKPFRCGGCGKNYAHRATLARHQLHYCMAVRAKCEDGSGGENNNHFLLFNRPQEEEETAEQQMDQQTGRDSLPLAMGMMTKQQQQPQQQQTKCKVCQKEFHDAGSLANHSRSHLVSKSCCLCGKVMGNKSKLLTHHRCHTKESPYACAFCDRRFSESSTLRKHEATHGARNFQCSVCDKGFVRKDYLAKHAATHRQTFRCSECPYVCEDGGEIQRHVAGVH